MNNSSFANLKRARLPGLLAIAAIALGMSFTFTNANAGAILSGSVGGVPTGADCYENFNSLTLGSAGGTTKACNIGVAFVTDASAVQGSESGKWAAPVLSGNNGSLFGDPNGPDASIYLQAGATNSNPGAGVTLTFDKQELYFGVLWGSVDSFNTLSFFQNGTQVAQFTGNDVSAAAGGGNCSGGNQGAIGTCYVNINFSAGDWFNSVVATSTSATFEFDNVAISVHNVTNVPEPGELGMFGFGLLLLGAGCWYRKRREA